MEQDKIIATMQTSRWQLIKLAIVFQCKLSIDAIRDLVLAPISIGCTLIDLIRGHEQHNSYFQKLMEYGHKSDIWLNLFASRQQNSSTKVGTLGNSTSEIKSTKESNKHDNNENVDQWFSKLESLIKQQHAKGGLTSSAKTTIDGYLDKLIDENKS